MKETIQALLTQLNHGLVGREETLRATLLTLLAGENIVLIGPPGTGKSLIARKIAQSLGQADTEAGYFEYLLTKFSTPEEIFGPLSISDLKENRFKRNTQGYLPSVRVAFLDEVFKASSSILNALLTILNERIFHNGAVAEQVPLRGLIAASNELPTDQEELSALYDRFLVRSFVDYIHQDQLGELLNLSAQNNSITAFDLQTLQQIHTLAEQVTMPSGVQQALLNIWAAHAEAFKEDRSEQLSDRRFTKIAHLLRVSAATNGRPKVDLSDLLLLKDCLWNRHENAATVKELVLTELRAFSWPVELDEAESEVIPQEQNCISELHAKIKGLRGIGTHEDPFLIANHNDLGIMHRSDVGQGGHHFRQTEHIDLSDHSHWTDIAFKGHYDGGGFSITYKKEDNLWRELFSIVDQGSTVTDLVLCDLRLANKLVQGRIERCTTDIAPLVCSATASVIQNCCINMTQAWFQFANGWAGHSYFSPNSYERIVAGVCLELNKQSQVLNCFVAGQVKPQSNSSFVGIAASSNASGIHRCAVGVMEVHSMRNRICSSDSQEFNRQPKSSQDSNPELKHNTLNVSIDSNSGTDDPNGPDGKTIAAAQFNQSYLEYTLEWDFDTIWQWNEDTDQPVLRSPQSTFAGGISSGEHIDLLSQQVRNNIWL
ncbi:AAA family ATPase [Echinimonas agarilytica]|uniref:AAA family ATPase n=1 Tax=Echinimonas agarilytica TaxID=1215918 RepID=A0AA42B5T2_9GAMM|nr:AAA family ATPase [Echinimonas agarilytica]MCM2678097.1 AAA family ATPase [Echinimonas agarilytica]